VQQCQYSDWLLAVERGVQISSGVIDVILPKTEGEEAAGHLPSLRIEVKNDCNYTTSPPYAFMTWTGTTLTSQTF
jgi:hypothetical protein